MLPSSCSSVRSSDASVKSNTSTLASSFPSTVDEGRFGLFSLGDVSGAGTYCIELDESPAFAASAACKAGHERRFNKRPGPRSIACTLEMGDRTYTRHIEFTTFRKWDAFAELLRILEDDFGTPCVQLWDVKEDMEIMAGDWEARAHPGWEINVVCAEGFVDADSEYESGSDDEEHRDVVRGLEREMWRFSRWRWKVEGSKSKSKSKSSSAKGDRAWVIGAVGMLGVVAAFCVIVAR